MSRPHFLLCFIIALAVIHAGYTYTIFITDDYFNENLDLLYGCILYIFVSLYLKEIKFKIPGSFDYGLFVWIFYPVIVPWALIKQKKLMTGVLFSIGLFLLTNIAYYVWITASYFFIN